MSRFWMVPVHVDALELASPMPAQSRFMDFDLLPYYHSVRRMDVHGDRPNLSSEIDSEAFNSENLLLDAGVHLHWALPDGLTRGSAIPTTPGEVREGDPVEFPSVPNRWLVVRSRSNGAGGFDVAAAWIVESDFVTEEKNQTGSGSSTISYPVPLGPSNTLPFRYMGRVSELKAGAVWTESQEPQSYLKNFGMKLTAVGYGEPTFAAFYPNCIGVFGMRDPHVAETGVATRYEILGWYSDAANDPFNSFVVEFGKLTDDEIVLLLNRYGGEPGESYIKPGERLTGDLYRKAFLRATQERFLWTAAPADLALNRTTADTIAVRTAGGEDFEGLLCYSRLDLPAGPLQTLARDFQSTKVAIGNTAGEALSAWLADELKGSIPTLSRSLIEEQLESLELAPALAGHDVDLGPKFQEARHAKGFTPVASESIWNIRPPSDAISNLPSSGSSSAGQPDSSITLPDELASALNRLNLQQQKYDRAGFKTVSLRQDLFDSWQKYMKAAFPANDEFTTLIFGVNDAHPLLADDIREFMASSIKDLQSHRDQRGEIWFDRTNAGVVARVTGPPASMAAKLKAALDDTARLLDGVNAQRTALQLNPLLLQQGAGPRFYEPNDPVILLVDPLLKPTRRHGQDGRRDPGGFLECQTAGLQIARTSADLRLAAALKSWLDGIAAQGGNIGFFAQTQQPWNPFLLEWEVLVESAINAGNLAQTPYRAAFVRDDPALTGTLLDFSVPASVTQTAKLPQPFRGRTILSPQSVDLLEQRLRDYLETRGIDLPAQPATDDSTTLTNYFHDLDGALADPANEAIVHAQGADPALRTVWEAARKVLPADFQCLAQSMGGFNRGLLMHRTALQLAVADPIAEQDPDPFNDYKTFARDVARQVGNIDRLDTAESGYSYQPIRTGLMALERLRVVDTFGQVKIAPVSTVCSEAFRGATDNMIYLPPRFTQPARLSLRWIAAGAAAEVETNDHPATTPICGWIVPDLLSQSLDLFDARGIALGRIEQTGGWRMAAGPLGGPVRLDDIPEPNLRRLAKWIAEKPERPLKLLDRLETALETIDPENFANHRNRAVLLGRPLALVRAILNLEQRDPPAKDQSWIEFMNRLKGNAANSREFEKVEFPIRLGDSSQMNDGLAEYWVELADGLSDPFAKGADGIVWQSLQSDRLTVDLLVDPRAAVHATCGILPTKAITIPPDQYVDALKNMQVSLLTAPVLTEPGRTILPLPSDPGVAWTWLQRDGAGWSMIHTDAVLDRAAILDAFPAQGPLIWSKLAESGWTQLISEGERALVIPLRSDPLQLDLGVELNPLRPDIRRVVAASTRWIEPVSLNAGFGPRQEIREGYLQFNPGF